MSRLPKKCIVDTNVPITANRANNPQDIPEELKTCVLTCIDAIEHVVEKGILYLDINYEIFHEYQRNLSMSGQPGIGDTFMKWVHDNQGNNNRIIQVKVTKNGQSYDEFPNSKELINFDDDDRKFIAVANAHHEKPPILQATDSTWWGWKEALSSVGIDVCFLCPYYVKEKYKRRSR